MALILGGVAHDDGGLGIIDGRTCKVPGTLHTPWAPPIAHDRAWWESGEWGTKPRTGEVNLLVGHWTAGEAGTNSVLDDGPRVVIGMKHRQGITQPQNRLRVAVQFVIGADDAAGVARIWQTADPLLTAAIHVGLGAVNDRSIGVEIVNKGAPPALKERPRPVLRLPVAGIPLLRQLAYQPGQLRSWCALADLLASHFPIPRQVPARAIYGQPGILTPSSDRFTAAQQRRWKGMQEHLHVPTTHKLDGGSQLIRVAAAHGWDMVQVA